MRYRITIGLACTVLAASLTLAGSPELVRNGGAEEGLDGWTIVDVDGGGGIYVEGYPLRGELSFGFGASVCVDGNLLTTCSPGLQQVLQTVPGQEYELSFFIVGRILGWPWPWYFPDHARISNVPLGLGIDVNGDGLFTANEEREYATTDYPYWGRVVVPFTAQSTLTAIRFKPKPVVPLNHYQLWGFTIAGWNLDEVSTVKVRTFSKSIR